MQDASKQPLGLWGLNLCGQTRGADRRAALAKAQAGARQSRSARGPYLTVILFFTSVTPLTVRATRPACAFSADVFTKPLS